MIRGILTSSLGVQNPEYVNQEQEIYLRISNFEGRCMRSNWIQIVLEVDKNCSQYVAIFALFLPV